MAYRYNCPICSSPVAYDTSYMDYIVIEETAECAFCNLYRSDYLTGGYQLRIGFWEWDWSYSEGLNEYTRRQAQVEKATTLTQELIADPEWPLWRRVTEVWPTEEPELFRAFSDWNRDRSRWELADQISLWMGEVVK